MFRQRALGAILGSAIGDALGAPFEFGPSKQYSRRFPQPVFGGIGELIGGGAFNWAPGEFTDDTQMAIVQAESLLARGRSRSTPTSSIAFGFGRSPRRCRQPDARRAWFEPRLGDGRSRLLPPESEQQRRQRLADAGDADGGALRSRRTKKKALPRRTSARRSRTAIPLRGGARRSTT